MKIAPSQQKSSSVEYAIDIVSVSKSFERKRADRGGYTTIKSMIVNLFSGTKIARGATHVLRDLTLRIPRGASVGLIGRNGAGKSTFLKLLTGIYKPDKGTISVNGRIAALIELGAGFHPDFSGRENLILGGIMHGLSRAEISARFDQIVDFAELREVIDAPVRTYSSGMFMRLGFSLAVHTDPDILLIDEVLAVGDASFVSKCKEKLSMLRRDGKTLVLVSHDLGAIERWSDEVLWLQDGEVRDRGEPRRVIDRYRTFVESLEEREHEIAEDKKKTNTVGERSAPTDSTERWGSREVEITGVSLHDKGGNPHYLFHPDDPFEVVINYKVNEPRNDIVFGIAFVRSDGGVVHGTNTQIERIDVPPLMSIGSVRYKVARNALVDGSYTLDIAIHRSDGYPYDYMRKAVSFAVRSPVAQVGAYVPEHSWSFE